MLLAGCIHATSWSVQHPYAFVYGKKPYSWSSSSRRKEYGNKGGTEPVAVFLSSSEFARFELPYVGGMKDYVVLQLFSTKFFQLNKENRVNN